MTPHGSTPPPPPKGGGDMAGGGEESLDAEGGRSRGMLGGSDFSSSNSTLNELGGELLSEAESFDDVLGCAKQPQPSRDWTHPPLVKKYFNTTLKTWMPITIHPDKASTRVLGREEEEGNREEGSSHTESQDEVEDMPRAGRDDLGLGPPQDSWGAPGRQPHPPPGQPVQGLAEMGQRRPKAWDSGDRGCVAKPPDNKVQGKQEFLLCGHINLNKSPSAAAMFAKHQADEAAKFKMDEKGNVLSRVKLPANPKRAGKPLSVSEWRRNFSGPAAPKPPARGREGWVDRESQSSHTMTTRLRKKREDRRRAEGVTLPNTGGCKSPNYANYRNE